MLFAGVMKPRPKAIIMTTNTNTDKPTRHASATTIFSFSFCSPRTKWYNAVASCHVAKSNNNKRIDFNIMRDSRYLIIKFASNAAYKSSNMTQAKIKYKSEYDQQYRTIHLSGCTR